MRSRLDLHEILCKALGSRNVYYQPPASIQMKYPAIVYSRGNIINRHANDVPYMQFSSYEVTVIDKDPESKIVNELLKLPYCSFNRHYTSNNLNHDVFTLYY